MSAANGFSNVRQAHSELVLPTTKLYEQPGASGIRTKEETRNRDIKDWLEAMKPHVVLINLKT